jgi:trans-aconitate methyltransferase
VDRVDAVDVSAAMIAEGRRRPGGGHPNLRWITAPVETAPLDGPYALVTAGASLHWMPWETTMARLAGVMTPRAQLVVVEHGPRDVPWQDELVTVIKRHSRNPGYDPRFSVVAALAERGLFETAGSAQTPPVVFEQSVAEYVEQFHSRATLAREHMSPQEAAAFDRAVEAAVRPWADGDTLRLPIVAELIWGRPAP